ncbi:MAG: hypothetical protein ABWY68_09390 [Cryobacterium sp.]
MGTRGLLALAAVAAGVIALSGCAGVTIFGIGSPSSADPVDPGPFPRPAAAGEVLAQATVLQKDGESPQLCLGGVAESYPPQCGGPPIVGWDWAAVEQSETASGVTWGSYAITGTWDAKEFTVTGTPVPLSLYDPLAVLDPRLDEANAGRSDEATLQRYQDELHAADYNPAVASDWSDVVVLTDWPQNGYLWVTVIYDDGTIQDFFDQQWGEGIVAVQSALRDS